ncbi:DgyrCDS5731 [Dimorphilus gyrociliatus]|uniref:DgyrCDS5731 n=1 Tax=Dimorphilus gyrociliatus TaxID=2664684 RepID=A0A7I8VME8_9ANNE|nr:DgyrCDS5731 [Dimorphilus gyrociliatus]
MECNYYSRKESVLSLEKRDSGTCDHSEHEEDNTSQSQWPTQEMVYSLLTMLGTNDPDELSKTLLSLSTSIEACSAMRQCGCIALLVQLMHAPNTTASARRTSSAALHNLVHSQLDERNSRREIRVLRLLEQIRLHCDFLRTRQPCQSDPQPGPAIATLMKLSFDEQHRAAICRLGGLQAIADLLQAEHEMVGLYATDQQSVTMRRYACMALTNLTFGDAHNKRLLCSPEMKKALNALVEQLKSSSDDLRQVAASVLRNLSWRADPVSKKALREVGTVKALVRAAMSSVKEATLKSMLSALWNLSAHCTHNKADVCGVDGALVFLVATLTYKPSLSHSPLSGGPSTALAIVENGGGILRNVSSHVAIYEEYRTILRSHGALPVLLSHLTSSSLTIVSNACGTLWNLSARNNEDQHKLVELGAIPMLRNLVHSKHKMISMGSTAALRNLLQALPEHAAAMALRPATSPAAPGLYVRKLRAFEKELEEQGNGLGETCDNVDSPISSPEASPKHSPVFQRWQQRPLSLVSATYVHSSQTGEKIIFHDEDEEELEVGIDAHDDQATPRNSTLLSEGCEGSEPRELETTFEGIVRISASEENLLAKCAQVSTPRVRRSCSSQLKGGQKVKAATRPASIVVNSTLWEKKEIVLPSTSCHVLPDNFDILPPPPEFSCPVNFPEEPVKEVITQDSTQKEEPSIKTSESFERNQTEKMFNQLEEDASKILNRIKIENSQANSNKLDDNKIAKTESENENTATIIKEEKETEEDEKPKRGPRILKSFEHTDLKTIRTGKAHQKQAPVRKNSQLEKKLNKAEKNVSKLVQPIKKSSQKSKFSFVKPKILTRWETPPKPSTDKDKSKISKNIKDTKKLTIIKPTKESNSKVKTSKINQSKITNGSNNIVKKTSNEDEINANITSDAKTIKGKAKSAIPTKKFVNSKTVKASKRPTTTPPPPPPQKQNTFTRPPTRSSTYDKLDDVNKFTKLDMEEDKNENCGRREAVVVPFNYQAVQGDENNPMEESMTKTAMLLARRQQQLLENNRTPISASTVV